GRGCRGHGPDGPTAVVAEEVVPLQFRDAGAPVDVPAGDGAPERVAVLGHRHGQPPHVAAAVFREAVAAFHDVPAVILPAAACGRLEVDFLPGVLPYVGDVQIPRRPVKGELPRVAEAQRPDFGPRAPAAGKRVVR